MTDFWGKVEAGTTRGGFVTALGRLVVALTVPDLNCEVEADDPCRIRYGCFVPDLTGLASGPSADFQAGI